MELTYEVILILLLTGFVAGWVDTLAGGGGLITIPVMLLLGLPPATAIATNKVQSSGGTLIASLYFIRQGSVSLSDKKLMLLMTFTGALFGGLTLLFVDAKVLSGILPLLLLTMGLYFLVSPNLAKSDRKQRISRLLFAVLIATALGFYDGFFGPGTGSLMALAFVSLLGFNLAEATVNAKLLNFVSNFSALCFFMFFGEINWTVGLVMLLGQAIGATIAARMVLTHGVKIIRPIVVIVCFTMSIKLIFDIFK